MSRSFQQSSQAKTYKLWLPPNFDEVRKIHEDATKAKLEKEKALAIERAAVTAARALKDEKCLYVVDQTHAINSLGNVVKKVSSSKLNYDKIMIDAASVQGSVLNLQRSVVVLADTIGTTMAQPLSPPEAGNDDKILDPSAVIESLSCMKEIILEAISALSLIKAQSSAARHRVGILETVVNNAGASGDTLRSLAQGDPTAASSAIAVRDGVKSSQDDSPDEEGDPESDSD